MTTVARLAATLAAAATLTGCANTELQEEETAAAAVTVTATAAAVTVTATAATLTPVETTVTVEKTQAPATVTVTATETVSPTTEAAPATTSPAPAPSSPSPEPAGVGSGDGTGPSSSSTPPAEVTLAVVGDILLDRGVKYQMDVHGKDAVLADAREELRRADLTVGNLETPLGAQAQPIAKNFSFLSDPDTVDVLTDGGFDLVTLANNHILDHGVTGMRSTQQILDDANIRHVGVGENQAAAHEPTIVEVNGQRLAFLGYFQIAPENSDIDYTTWIAGPDQPGVAWADPARVRQDVARAKAHADHVIVMLHAGRELGSTQLTTGQVAAGQAALDAGATAVLGAHPHVLQAWQWSGDQFIAWSLGNFVFDFPNGSPQTDSVILHLTLDADGVNEVSWSPVKIIDTFPRVQDPRTTDGTRIQQVLDGLEITP